MSNAQAETNSKYYQAEFSPGFSSEQWLELLHDKDIFNVTALAIMKRFLDIGGEATCIQLADKYGESSGFYNMGSQQLARRIHAKTNCPLVYSPDGAPAWWPILFVGRTTEKGEKGAFVWKLRDELATALKETDLSEIPLYPSHSRIAQEEKGAGLADDDVSTVHYWMFSPGENGAKWEEFYQAGIMAIGWDEIGDLSL